MRAVDVQTADLFAQPVAASTLPGQQDYRAAVSEVVASMLEDAARAGRDRYAVAADMSRLTGRAISKQMLDGYSSPARDQFNLPFVLAPVIEVVCDSHALGSLYAQVRGSQLLVGRDTINAEIGRLEREAAEAKRKADEAKRRANAMKAYAGRRA